jgi:hypothetical protein
VFCINLDGEVATFAMGSKEKKYQQKVLIRSLKNAFPSVLDVLKKISNGAAEKRLPIAYDFHLPNEGIQPDLEMDTENFQLFDLLNIQIENGGKEGRMIRWS